MNEQTAAAVLADNLAPYLVPGRFADSDHPAV